MNIQEELKEVEKRLRNSTSHKNKRDLQKYKKRLLRELKKEGKHEKDT
ncbi:MAG: hypothetical protein RR585_01785 [Coprobacillus sp.]